MFEINNETDFNEVVEIQRKEVQINLNYILGAIKLPTSKILKLRARIQQRGNEIHEHFKNNTIN